ncbi:MAG TPA: hypothetical protein VGB25_08380, partial [Candidatus Binatia bacterium]
MARPIVTKWLEARRKGTLQARGRLFNPRVVERLLDYLKPHRLAIAWALSLVALTSAMHLVGPYLLKVAIDDYLVERQDALGLSFLSLGYALTLLIAWASEAGESYTTAAVSQRVLKRIRDQL